MCIFSRKSIGAGFALAIIVLLLAPAGFCQPQPMDTLWTKTYGDIQFDRASGVVETADGDIVIAGTSYNVPNANYDVRLVKTTSEGDSVWSRLFGDMRDNGCQALSLTTDGGFILAGYTEAGYINHDVLLIKTDGAGNMEWESAFGGDGWDTACTVQQTTDGGYVIFGNTDSFGATEGDMYLVKTDALGNLEWQNHFHNAICDHAFDGLQTSDGGYLLAGITNSSPGIERAYAVKTDSAGEMEWDLELEGDYSARFYTVCKSSDGGYLFIGWNYVPPPPSYTYLVKTDPEGSVEWEQTLDDDTYRTVQGLVQTEDGGYQLGCTAYQEVNSNDFCIVKVDAFGGFLQSAILACADNDYTKDMTITVEKDVILCGKTETYGAGSYDMFVVRSEGFPTTLTIHLPDTMTNAGEAIYIPVHTTNISPDDSVLAYQMVIDYDPSFGYFDSAMVEGCITPEFYSPVWSFSQPGIVNGGYLNLMNLEVITGEGVLCYLRFIPESSITGTMPLNFESFLFNEITPNSVTYDGSIIIEGDPVGVEDPVAGSVPQSNALYINYPNPFNSSTAISYQLQAASYMELTIYDIQGREVAKLVDGWKAAGVYEVVFDGGDFSSGIYFARLTVGGLSETRKMVLIR